MSEELEPNCNDPETMVRVIKYYSQEFVKGKKNTPFKLIRCKGEYVKNKKKYDQLFNLCEKYKIKTLDYIKFSILMNGTKTVDTMLSVQSFLQYANYKKRKSRYAKIYKYYMKSANNVVDMCIKNGYTDTIDCLRHLIQENRLGYEYLSGRLSKYYLASIQNFKKIYEKLDRQSKEELCIIHDVADELNKYVQDTFKEFRNMHVHTISFTDKLLKTKLTTKNNN